MDATPELVEALKNGEKVELILAPDEPVQNAHVLFNRLELEHSLNIGRRPRIVNGRIGFIVWAMPAGNVRPVGY